MLKLSDVSASYGPIQALRGVSLEVSEGQIVALLGANGAGKSSTLKVISGILRPSGGTVTFEGQTLHRDFEPWWLGWLAVLAGALVPFWVVYCLFAYRLGQTTGQELGLGLELPLERFRLRVIGWGLALLVPGVNLIAIVHLPTICFQQGLRVGSLEGERGRGDAEGEGSSRADGRARVAHGKRSPEEIVAMGISHVPEGRELFAELTVEENLRLGAYSRGGTVEGDIERIFTYFPILAERRKQPAGSLSGGEQQMLAIGRGLMAQPKLLVLDEPSLGLAPTVVQEIFGIIRAIAQEEGLTVLLVEQNATMALSISQYGYVLETGSIVLEAEAAGLKENETVRRSYLGY